MRVVRFFASLAPAEGKKRDPGFEVGSVFECAQHMRVLYRRTIF